MTQMFGATDTLATKMWKAYRASPTLLYQMSQCDRPGNADHTTLMRRFDRLATMIPPASLIAASVQVAPEGTHSRPREHVAFEERVLRRTDAGVRWK